MLLALALAIALRVALAGVPAAGAEPRGAPGPGPRDLVELMARFSDSGIVRARVEETRRLALLSEPVDSEGFVYFAPPDRLLRATTRPGKSRVVVNGTRAAFFDETGHRTLDLVSSEVAQALIGTLMVVLRGDLPALQSRCSVEFRVQGNAWQLDLEPRSRAVRELIANTRFRGRGWMIHSMETQETNGDRSLALLLDVEVGVELAPEELERIFSLEPPPRDAP
jgi:outer membrane lipoprotein-sorting protein